MTLYSSRSYVSSYPQNQVQSGFREVVAKTRAVSNNSCCLQTASRVLEFARHHPLVLGLELECPHAPILASRTPPTRIRTKEWPNPNLSHPFLPARALEPGFGRDAEELVILFLRARARLGRDVNAIRRSCGDGSSLGWPSIHTI